MATPSIAAIQDAVCKYYDIPINRLLCHRRDRKWARPRQVAMYLAWEMTDATMPEIGRAFNRDQTTVTHAIAVIGRMRRNG